MEHSTRHSWRQAFVLAVAAAVLATPTLAGDDATAERIRIRAKTVITGDGQTFAPGEILVKDGKIAFVGESIELGLPAVEVEAETVIAGLVNASSSAGLSGGAGEVSREVTPDFDTTSAIDGQSSAFVKSRAQGETTLQILPATESVFCGFSCLVKSAKPIESMLNPRQNLVLAICTDPTSRNRSRSRPDSIYVRQPTNRMGVVWIVRSSLHRVANGKPASGADPEGQQILADMLSGKHPVVCVSRADVDIHSTLELAAEFNLKPTIYGGDEVYRVLDEVREAKVPVVYTALTSGATASTLRGSERTELRWNIPGLLQEQSIEFCLAGRDLLEQARFAARFGLSAEQALHSVTLGPAKLLGIEERVGSITVGKDADLVALSGDPLQPSSGVQWTMVDGKIYQNPNSQ